MLGFCFHCVLCLISLFHTLGPKWGVPIQQLEFGDRRCSGGCCTKPYSVCGGFVFLILFARVALLSLPYCSVVRYPSLELGRWCILAPKFSVHVAGVAGELWWDVVPLFHARRSCLGARAGVDPFPARVQLAQWLSVRGFLGGPLCRARWGVAFGVCVGRPSLSTWMVG